MLLDAYSPSLVPPKIGQWVSNGSSWCKIGWIIVTFRFLIMVPGDAGRDPTVHLRGE